MRGFPLLLAPVLVLGVTSLGAEEPRDPDPATDPSVRCVVDGGAWQEDDRRGTVRVVVADQGWDHAASSVWIEWIGDPPDENRPSLRLAVSELGPYVGLRFGCPRPHVDANGTRFEFDAAEARAPERLLEIRLSTTRPGRYSFEMSE